jgi:hypothetical protein
VRLWDALPAFPTLMPREIYGRAVRHRGEPTSSYALARLRWHRTYGVAERNFSEPCERTHAARPSRGCFDALYRLRSGFAGANAGVSLDADCAPIPRIAASSIAMPTSKSPYRGFE